MAQFPLSAVYSSPLLRARQTAEAIAEPHRMPVEIVEELIEADVGQWEGLSWDQIQRNDPEAYEAFMTDAAVHPYSGGENLRTVETRIVPAFERLMVENIGRPVAVVAHNVVNRAYLAPLLGLPLSCYRAVPQDNCGVNLLRYRDGEVKPVTVNAVFHLADERRP